MKILAIDPGLDVTGLAVFDVEAFRTAPTHVTDFERALTALVHWDQIVTPAAEVLPVRLQWIGMMVGNIVRAWDPEIVYIEEPAFDGDYKAGRRERVNKLYKAIGSIEASAQRLARVVEVRAGREEKKFRHRLLETAASKIGRELPTGPRGAVLPDVWDAIYLGCLALTTRVERELKSPSESATGT